MLVRVEVELLLLVQHLQRPGRLVGDVVRGHVQRRVGAAGLLHGQLVVRRPLLVRRERVHPEQRDDHGDARPLIPLHLAAEQHGQPAGRDHAPGQRRQLEERQRGEHRDPGDAPGDVQPVGGERLEPDEQPADRLPEPGHHGHAEQEDDGQADRPGQRGHTAEPPVRVLPLFQRGQDDGEPEREADQQRERHRRPAQEVPVRPGVEEAEADAQEAGQQHEVRGRGQVDVARRGPSDQRQLNEQHQEAGERQPPALRAPGRRGLGLRGFRLGGLGIPRLRRRRLSRGILRPGSGAGACGAVTGAGAGVRLAAVCPAGVRLDIVCRDLRLIHPDTLAPRVPICGDNGQPARSKGLVGEDYNAG